MRILRVGLVDDGDLRPAAAARSSTVTVLAVERLRLHVRVEPDARRRRREVLAPRDRVDRIRRPTAGRSRGRGSAPSRASRPRRRSSPCSPGLQRRVRGRREREASARCELRSASEAQTPADVLVASTSLPPVSHDQRRQPAGPARARRPDRPRACSSRYSREPRAHVVLRARLPAARARRSAARTGSLATGGDVLGAPALLQRGLRRGEPRERHAVRRAADVVEPEPVAELDRRAARRRARRRCRA